MAVHVQAAVLGCVILALCGAGCADDAPPAPRTAAQAGPTAAAVPDPRVRAAREEAEDGIQISGSGVLGSLSDDQIQGPIQQRWPEIQRCKTQVKPPWYVGGRVQLHFRITRDGDVKKVNIEESQLGNWGVERCILGIARTLHFSHPRGGEAEFSYPIEFAARAQVTEWPSDQISADMLKHKKELAQCDRVGARHPYKLTVYLGAGGKVASAGISFPDEIDEAYIDCVIGKAQTWKFTDPLGTVVRVSYQFRR